MYVVIVYIYTVYNYRKIQNTSDEFSRHPTGHVDIIAGHQHHWNGQGLAAWPTINGRDGLMVCGEQIKKGMNLGALNQQERVYIYRWLSCWWLSPTPLKNDGVRQLGL